MLKRLLFAALGLVWMLFAAGCAGSREPLQPTITAVSVSPGTSVLSQDAADAARSKEASPTSGKPVNAKVGKNATAVAAKQALDSACLVGLWEAVDLPNTMAESFRQTTTGLSLQGVDGRVLYRFETGGQFTIDFDHLTATLAGTMDDHSVTAQQILQGKATARYHVLPEYEEIVLSSFGGEGILFSLEINNQRLAEGNLPAWRALTNTLSDGAVLTPGPLMEQARAEVLCIGDQLILQTVDPEPGPEIVLHRVE